jgi:energy-coupling factor transport system ATP-binding protein
MGMRALEMCGLTALQNRYIWELSGGQKHLLALAGALSLEPEILVVDEPVSQLDPQHARQVYEVLRTLNEQYGKTIVVIEHHTEFIADYCQEVCLMEQGKVLWQRPVACALNSLADLERLGIQPPEVTMAAVRLAERLGVAQHPGEPARIGSDTTATPAIETEASALRSGLYPITTAGAEQYFRTLLDRAHASTAWTPWRARTDADLHVHRHADENARLDDAAITSDAADTAAQAQRTPLICFDETRLSYRTTRRQADREVLRGIDLRLYAGERIALVGNNGAGKSSLMKLIAGISRPTHGTVTLMGQSTQEVPIEQLSTYMAFVFQNPEDMFIADNVYQEVAYCLQSRHYPNAQAQAEQMLDHFRLQPFKDRDARLLSGGQQRRVSLAIGAAIEPQVILLDEPTANLDLATRAELLGTLAELQEHVRTVLIATHDMQLVRQWATRVIVMHEGMIAGDGSVEDIFSDTALIRTAGLAPTQLMDLSARLGIHATGSSPADFAQQLYELIMGSRAKTILNEESGAYLHSRATTMLYEEGKT